MTTEAAGRAIAAWQAEAAVRGLSRGDPTFCGEGEAWIPTGLCGTTTPGQPQPADATSRLAHA